MAFKDDLKILIASTFDPKVNDITDVKLIRETYFEEEDGNDSLIDELIQIVSIIKPIY